MSAGLYNALIEQGEDFGITVFWKDDAGNSVDLTGFSAQMMIRQNYDDPYPLVTVSSPSSGIVLGGTAGTVAISIPVSVTSALPSGCVVYDLKMTDANGLTYRLLQGSINIVPSVTR